MRDDIAGVNADPDVKLRIFQQLDAPHELDAGMTGHNGVVVVCVRRTKQRNQPVAAFLADDPAVTTNCRAHGDQGRLKPGNRFFGIELRDQIGRTLQVGTENGEEFSLAGDTATRVGCGGLVGWLGTTAPHAEQNRSPALSVDEQTWQDTLSFLHPYGSD